MSSSSRRHRPAGRGRPRRVDEIAQIAEVVLQQVDRAQTVQRPHHVIGVADPAVAVVPVAPALGRLGHRGGHGRDDRAGFLIGAELQRDRRADHRLLTVERQVEGAHPVLPIGDGAVQGGGDAGADVLVVALVGTEEEGVGPLQPEGPLVEDVGHRTVGGQPEGHVRAQIADVVRTVRRFGPARAPVGRRAQAHADARRPAQRPDDPAEGQRPIGAAVFRMARREVDDLDRRPVRGRQHRAQDRRVADIGLFDASPALPARCPRSRGPGRIRPSGPRTPDRRPPAARRPRR